MKALLMVLVLSGASAARAQRVEVLYQAPVSRPATGQFPAMLPADADTSRLQLVATIRATGRGDLGSPTVLYEALAPDAMRLGGTALRLVTYGRQDSSRRYALTVHAYAAPQSLVDTLLAADTNNVYLFSGSDPRAAQDVSFQLNDTPRTLPAGRYYRLVIPTGGAVHLGKGGFTGASATLSWKPGRAAAFFSVSGPGVGAAPAGMAGLSFSSGRITPLPPNLGRLLAQLEVLLEVLP